MGLNTLTGGHPLGGNGHSVSATWGGEWVSIPSQAGILLADRTCAIGSCRRSAVSIPSQAGILLAEGLRKRPIGAL